MFVKNVGKKFVIIIRLNILRGIDMPQHEEHCEHSFKRYGVRGDDIHTWIDEPSAISGGSHRQFRHDLNSLPLAIQLFSNKYGADMVENIFLDHLKADSEENRQHETERQKETHSEPYLDPTLKLPQIKVFEYKRKHKIVKISFKGVRNGQTLQIHFKVFGGNNDVKVGGQMIKDEHTFKMTKGSGYFGALCISNSFSWVTGKTVDITYRLISGLAYTEAQTTRVYI
jgi:hypothetical protein